MFDEVQIRAYTALLSAATQIEHIIDRDLRARVGVTLAQFEILVHLGQAPDGLRMNELAQGLILSRSGTTYRVQQLEAGGWVRRSPDSSDERGIVAHITKSGSALLQDAVPGHEALVQQIFFDALNHHQLTALNDALQATLAQLARVVDAERDDGKS